MPVYEGIVMVFTCQARGNNQKTDKKNGRSKGGVRGGLRTTPPVP